MSIFDPVLTQLNKPLLIEASAGTGKTYSLMHVILRIIVELKVPIERILIVTFTKNATYELKSRLRAKLSEVHNILQNPIQIKKSSDPTLDRQISSWTNGKDEQEILALSELIKTALDQIDDASVYTIHSFCQRMLQQYAFSSIAAFDLENSEADDLFAQTIDEVVRSEAKKIDDLQTRSLFLKATKDFKNYLNYLSKVTLAHDQIKFDISNCYEIEKDGKVIKTIPLKADQMSQALTNFCVEAPKKFKKLKAQKGVFTYDDLLVQTEENLRKTADSKEGLSLAQIISNAYDAVLIDEFQDTDSIQYSIFKTIFIDNPKEGRPVIFVGDPKQSIYGWRSAEIECYLEARDSMASTSELTTNYRSTPGLVEAANAFFTSESFINKKLSYTDIESVEKNLPLFKRRKEDGYFEPQTPFEVWLEPEKEKMPAKKFHELEDWAVAEDIAKLLSGDYYIYSRGKLRPLCNGDIAILVRKRFEAYGVIKKLAERHIRCIIDDRQNVLKTGEATEILRILQAMENIKSNQAMNAARATRIFGEKLSSILTNEDARLNARLIVERANKVFSSKGVLAAFTEIFNEFKIEERLLKQSVGERALTNYQHVLDLLYKQNRKIKTISGLIRWMQKNKVREEDVSLRRESDADLVRIETIYQCKGLEYPVVYMIRSGAGHTEDAPAVIVSQDKKEYTFNSIYGNKLETDSFPKLEESIRLSYVAFTRASCRLVIPMFYNRADKPDNGIYLAHTNWGTPKCPIFQILAPDPKSRLEKHKALFEGLPAKLQGIDVKEKLRKGINNSSIAGKVLDRDIDSFVAGKVLCDYDVNKDVSTITPVAVAPALNLDASDPASRKINWIQTSFTRLTKDLPWSKEAPALDEVSDEESEQSIVEQGSSVKTDDDLLGRKPQSVSALTYGDFLHKLIEKTDFSLARNMEGNQKTLLRQVSTELIRFSIEKPETEELKKHAGDITEMLGHVLQTHAFEDMPNFRLCDLDRNERFSEMDFLITTGKPKPGRRALTGKDLGQMLALFDDSYKGLDLSNTDMTGYLNGSIDLTFFAEDKFWIIDWKSNLISPNPSDYTEKLLDQAMTAHHYTLQYLLYTIALKRFLEVRLGITNGYDKIGGIAYFFLRGVHKDHPMRGIFFRRPNKNIIDCLDDVLKNGFSEEIVNHYHSKAGESNG